MQLKTINKALNAKYPGLELVKGEGYYYFVGAEVELCRETGVYGVYRLNDLSLDAWVSEADDKMMEVAKHKMDRGEFDHPTVITLSGGDN